MRILFLDFDGVTHPLGLRVDETRTVNGKPVATVIRVDFFCWVDQLVELLQGHPDVRIVISSSWRDSFPLEELKAFLGPLEDQVVDVLPPDVDKWPAICEWVATQRAQPELFDAVTYRVLDDATEQFPKKDETGHEHFIACDYRTGITAPAVKEALIQWLTATAKVV
jgi:hypothetical protein